MKTLLFLQCLLLIGVGINSIKIIAYTQQRVSLTGEVHHLKIERDKLNSDWTQLLLTQKTLVNNHMIERAIKNGLQMHAPSSAQVVYLETK